MNDNRQHPRYATEFEVEVCVGVERMIGRTYNVSRGGLCLELVSAMEIGTVCDLGLALIFFEQGFSEQIAVRGMVVWSSRIKDRFQIGIKFGALDEQTQKYIDTFLHFLEGGEEDSE